MRRMDVKRIFNSPGIYISIIFGFIVLLQEGINTGLLDLIQNKINGNNIEFYTTVSLYGLTVFYSSFILFAPLLSAIPYSASFGEEYKHNYLKNILIRASNKRYKTSKILFTGLSGFLSLFIPLIIYGLLCQIFATPVDLSNQEHRQVLSSEIWSVVNTDGGFLYILVQSFIIGLFGCSWALVALAFSTVVTNRYAVYAFPFALCYFLNYIASIVNQNLISPYASIDPGQQVFNNTTAGWGFVYMIGYQAAVIILSIILFNAGYNRRSRNG